jgi:hypothetical protein
MFNMRAALRESLAKADQLYESTNEMTTVIEKCNALVKACLIPAP